MLNLSVQLCARARACFGFPVSFLVPWQIAEIRKALSELNIQIKNKESEIAWLEKKAGLNTGTRRHVTYVSLCAPV